MRRTTPLSLVNLLASLHSGHMERELLLAFETWQNPTWQPNGPAHRFLRLRTTRSAGRGSSLPSEMGVVDISYRPPAPVAPNDDKVEVASTTLLANLQGLRHSLGLERQPVPIEQSGLTVDSFNAALWRLISLEVKDGKVVETDLNPSRDPNDTRPEPTYAEVI
jgi:hypothetical protein